MTTTTQITQANLEAQDIQNLEKGVSGLVVLQGFGLLPCFLLGAGWISVTWPVGLPLAALTVAMARQASARRHSVDAQRLFEQTKQAS